MDGKDFRLDEANLKIITFVFESICVGLNDEQREAISKRMQVHAERVNDSAQNGTDKLVATVLFSLSQTAVGKNDDAIQVVNSVYWPGGKPK